jgi:prepilin-type N-terminal cleavage/methylation domain-containing protein
MRTHHHGRSSQRGFTLAEILVASAIFTVIVVAALLMYDRSNQVFKQSSESIDMQQNTRVAFDKLVADLRMAGFDYDRDGIPSGTAVRPWQASTTYQINDVVTPPSPNGHQYVCIQGGQSGPSEPGWLTGTNATFNDNTARWQENAGVNVYQQPDEQIEYAGQTAITIRANYDYDANERVVTDPLRNDHFNGREKTLESRTPQFPVITTGNDEIVTYALVSDKGRNNDVIRFYADINNEGDEESRRAYPGGSAERLVEIGGVDLSNTQPPYTLYRITFDDHAHIVRTPVANNIRSMRFKYYEDTTGDTTLKNLDATPADVSNGIGGEGPYNPAAAEAVVTDRLIRAKIRSTVVELIGMNPNTERGYVDNLPPWNATTPADRDTVSPNTRKVKLSTLVVPRNLGKRGLREQSTTEPGAPVITDICVGYCGLVKISWQAPSTGGVDQYAIAYDTNSSGNFVQTVQVGPVTTGYVTNLSPDQSYYFKVMAINDYGAASSAVSGSAYVPASRTTPADPSGVSATGDRVATRQPGKVVVTWNAPAGYSGQNQLSCTSGSQTATTIPPAEAITYNVWRSTTSTVDTSQPPYVSYAAGGSNPSINYATGVVTFTDTNVVPCMTYYYKVQAVKQTCETPSSRSVSPSIPHSNIVPSTPVQGSASLAAPPSAPADLQYNSATSTCTAGQCTVNLDWPKVVTDTSNNTLVVDQYEILRTQKLNGTTTTSSSAPQSTLGTNTAIGAQTITVNNASATSGATATYTDTVPETDRTGTNYSYEYKVRAVVCSTPGAYSPPRIFPCTFAGGTVGVSIASTSYFQGNGLIDTPYYVNVPLTLTATSGSPVQSMHALLYRYASNTYALVQDMGTRTGPLQSAAWSVDGSIASAGVEYMFEVTFTDTAGCSTRARTYFINEGVSCCLQNQTSNASVVSFTAGTTKVVDLFAKSICSNALTIQPSGIVFTWTDLGQGSTVNSVKLDKVEYPTTASSGSNVANCSWDNTIKCYTYDPRPNQSAGTFTIPTTSSGNAAPQQIAANSSSATSPFRVRVYYIVNCPGSGVCNLTKQPITAFSFNYMRSGDASATTCPIVP